VLAHARLEERRGPRHVESLSLASLIERVRGPLERAAASSGMTLDVGTDGSVAAPLTVDPDAIGQILANLVDNAAKYAHGGESATISLHASVQNGSLVLAVRDHGPGVPSEQARAIFAPFERGAAIPPTRSPASPARAVARPGARHGRRPDARRPERSRGVVPPGPADPALSSASRTEHRPSWSFHCSIPPEN
jgi:hypothetical protein